VILREIIPALVACSCLSPSALAQKVPPKPSQLVVPSVVDVHDFYNTVLPITDLKLGFGIEAKFGTGFCLDPACRFIGTNYHVAVMARPHKIMGVKVVQRYLATGPDDEGATVNEGPSLSPMKYNLGRDLAIMALRSASATCKLGRRSTYMLIPKSPAIPFAISYDFTVGSKAKRQQACSPLTTTCPLTRRFVPVRAAV